jgi:predicted CoA-binding protein
MLRLFTDAEIEHALRTARRVGVLGMRSEEHRDQAAHHIPAYLAEVGYELVPVPYKPIGLPTILGFPVCTSLREAHDLDILNVFLRPERVAPYLDDILYIRPKVVWFQSGLLHLPSAEAIAAAGLGVVHDCIGCRRAAIAPACLPLEGQGGSAEG